MRGNSQRRSQEVLLRVPNEDFGLGEHHADRYREAIVEAENGKEVKVEEYPGGDMTIYTSKGDQLYFSSEEASALRTCLGRIDGGKHD